MSKRPRTDNPEDRDGGEDILSVDGSDCSMDGRSTFYVVCPYCAAWIQVTDEVLTGDEPGEDDHVVKLQLVESDVEERSEEE